MESKRSTTDCGGLRRDLCLPLGRFRASANVVIWSRRGCDLLVIAWLALAFLFNYINDGYMYASEVRVTNHFDAVYHAVAQVHLGKTLLVDTLNQYGQYPELLAPLFAVTGLSVRIFSCVMQTVTVVAFGCLYLFLRRTLRNPLVAFVTFLAILASPYFLHNTYEAVGTIYYQYIPIRFLFPCLLIYLSGCYLETRNRWLYFSSFPLYTIGILWNLDTGIVVFLTWLLTLCYEELVSRPARAGILHVCRHVAIALGSLLLVIGIYYGTLRTLSGHWPDFGQLSAYQRLYYFHGFYMLPMPGVHPWNLVLLIYALGLACAGWRVLNCRLGQDGSQIFLVSILGIGIFTYYQGRSHDSVFVFICYPALLLIGLFVDRVLERIPLNPGAKLGGLVN